MKSRKEMSRQHSDKAPVTFHDVAAYFSEEEWKLLTGWQKEIYKNAIMEIHQTLFSLGYAIVNPGTLLRFIKREDRRSWNDGQDSERRASIRDPTSSRYASVCPDILLRIKQEENLFCKDRYVPEETEMYRSPCKGDEITNPDDLLKIKIEDNPYLKDPWDAEEREQDECLSTGFPFLSTDNSLRTEEDSNQSSVDRPVLEGDESSAGSSSDHKVITSVISFVIKEEGEPYSIGHQDSGSQGSIRSPTAGVPDATSELSLRPKPEEETHFREMSGSLDAKNTGDNIMKGERKDGDSAVITEKLPPCKTLSSKVKAMMPHRFGLNTNYRSQLWSDSNQDLGGGTTVQCESSFNYNAQYNVRQQSTQVEPSEKRNECSSTQGNAKLLISQHNELQTWQPYTFSECGKTYRQTIGLIPQQRTHSVKMSNKPADFEKSFSLKQRMVKHPRACPGTRVYQCAECEKSFKIKDHLIRHRRIHTGERPYHCTQCEKSFSQKHHLTGHQRTHTGERPYQCTKCRKSFTQKGSLIRHNRTHTGERPYECAECEQSFSLKEALIRHQRAHMMARMV